ncbi:MAG: AMP-binding protein [Lentisphaerae bacterium]|nr:AMP-binding protein [Lentisphaerota bacterium]
MMTIKRAFVRTYHRQADQVALRYKADRVWNEVTWRELMARVRQVSEILNLLKVKPGQHVAIHLDNCRQWMEIYLGVVSGGCTAVPIDAKLHPQEVAHILHDSEAVLLFGSARTFATLKEIQAEVPALSNAVLVDGESILSMTDSRFTARDYEQTLAQVQGASERDDSRFNRCDPDQSDVASIIYTSGTTGRPKGAMLTHGNFSSNVESMMHCLDVRPSDNLLLVLPLHHAFAFSVNFLLPLFCGAQVSFVQSLKTVGEDAREVSPTLLVGVPLLLEKLYARIMGGMKKNRLGYFLYRAGLKRPVIKAVQSKLGGRLRACVVGGAPSSTEVLRGYAALGIPVIEGYGLTETAPVLTFNPLNAPLPGSVGIAVPGVEVKIREPDEEGIGEIMGRGPNIMKGYFKNPQATAEVMDGAWFRTGDLGYINPDGYVIITGRIKSLIVNREGKNIYPEEIEAQILTSNRILEAIVVGFTEEGETGERVGVIVVPNLEVVETMRTASDEPFTVEALTELMVAEVKRVTRSIADYKRPRRIEVRTEAFEKTSTSKVKRFMYAMGER